MKLLLTFTCLLPLLVYAQRIKRNEMDKFTRQPVIVTEPEVLRQGVSTGISVHLKAEGPRMFVVFSGYGPAAATISVDDAAIFLLSNDSTVTVKSAAMQTFELNQNNKYVYNHQYSITREQLETLSRANVRSIRKYHFKGYADVAIAERHRDKLRRLSALFLNAYTANQEHFAVPVVTLAQAGRHVGDSVRVCGKVYGGRYLATNDGKPTLLNVGGSYPNQPLTVVIWGAHRKSFEAEPEVFYKDKEVCVEGRISLYRDKPQIAVAKPAQIEIQDEVEKTSRDLR